MPEEEQTRKRKFEQAETLTRFAPEGVKELYKAEGGKARTLTELRVLGIDTLALFHDALAANTQVGVNYYLDEIAQRDAMEVNNQMLALTERVTWMTATMLDYNKQMTDIPEPSNVGQSLWQ